MRRFEGTAPILIPGPVRHTLQGLKTSHHHCGNLKQHRSSWFSTVIPENSGTALQVKAGPLLSTFSQTLLSTFSQIHNPILPCNGTANTFRTRYPNFWWWPKRFWNSVQSFFGNSISYGTPKVSAPDLLLLDSLMWVIVFSLTTPVRSFGFFFFLWEMGVRSLHI